MIKELPILHNLFEPLKHKRFYEVQNERVRVFGHCEVTHKEFEMFIPTIEFFIYIQREKSIGEALKSVPKEEREFLMSGTSPEGWKVLFPDKPGSK